MPPLASPCGSCCGPPLEPLNGTYRFPPFSMIIFSNTDVGWNLCFGLSPKHHPHPCCQFTIAAFLNHWSGFLFWSFVKLPNHIVSSIPLFFFFPLACSDWPFPYPPPPGTHWALCPLLATCRFKPSQTSPSVTLVLFFGSPRFHSCVNDFSLAPLFRSPPSPHHRTVVPFN